MALTDEQLERYSRHIILKGFGVKGQKRLAAGSVLIVGAGGLGSPAALYLAAAGVGRVGIVDSDAVELSNLQRQSAHTTDGFGKRKTASAAAAMRAINPDVEVIEHDLWLDASNVMDVIAPYDFIIEGVDNFPTKFLVNDACVLAGKPFCHGGILRFQGQLMTYVPRRGPCYRCAFNEAPPEGTVPSCSQAVGKILTYDAFFGDFDEIQLPEREPNCAVCGDHPTITELSDYGQPACRV